MTAPNIKRSRRSSGGSTYSVDTVAASASGNTPLATPSPGARVRLHYLQFNAKVANAGAVEASLRFGAAGDLKYTTDLTPGSIFGRNIGAGRRFIEGDADEPLFLNLTAARAVNATVEWEEVL